MNIAIAIIVILYVVANEVVMYKLLKDMEFYNHKYMIAYSLILLSGTIIGVWLIN